MEPSTRALNAPCRHGHGHIPVRPRLQKENAAPVIELQNVSFAYGSRNVLTQVNLTVRASDFMAIVGPNGGGKTTLVKLILGLLPPGDGRIRVLGQTPEQSRPEIGYVPQHAFIHPNFPITVRDAVLLGLRRKGRRWPGYLPSERKKAEDVLHLVGMAELGERRFDALSGGQKQRVLVARALVSNPALLLFDEPTANIDPQGKVCLFELLSALSASITIVMVSHDLISASARITSVAAVNKHLIQNSGNELTPDMLALIYGTHDASCPMDEYIRGLSSVFGQTRPEEH